MTERETRPCASCGKPTPMLGTKRCDNCWEVESRLSTYMRSPKALEFVRKHLPRLDDWVDGHCDAWDYERVLADNEVTVEWEHEAYHELCGWAFSWKHGAIHIGPTTEQIARKAAALFVSLWLRGVSASFCTKLMSGYIHYLECQENKRLTFLATIHQGSCGAPYFRFTRENFCTRESFQFDVERRIVDALGPVANGEEIIVTFTKRKKT